MATITRSDTQVPQPKSSSGSTGRGGDCQLDLSEVVVIIPALNEREALPLVLADLPRVGRVIVVDNGSTDGTGEIASQCGADVVLEPRRGYGQACLAGLAEVHSSQDSANAPDVVAFVDADYGDHPDLLGDIVSPILRGETDLVIGSRMRGNRDPGAMPPQAVWGNRFACFLMKLIWGAKFTDLGPMRAIRYSALQSLRMRDENYGWTVEMQIKALRANLRYLEIPVPYRKRVGVSKISGTLTGTVRAGYKILATIFRYGIRGT